KFAYEGRSSAVAAATRIADTRPVDEPPSRNFTMTRPAAYGAPDAPTRSRVDPATRTDSRMRVSQLSGARETSLFIRPRSIAGGAVKLTITPDVGVGVCVRPWAVKTKRSEVATATSARSGRRRRMRLLAPAIGAGRWLDVFYWTEVHVAETSTASWRTH